MRKALVMASFLFFGALPVGKVLAHAFLSSAVPAVGSTVTVGPKELRLQFSEAVEIKFSSVKIITEGGKEIGPVRITLNPSDPQRLIVSLPEPLTRGMYIVKWRVVSVDTHKTQGDYRFTVRQ